MWLFILVARSGQSCEELLGLPQSVGRHLRPYIKLNKMSAIWVLVQLCYFYLQQEEYNPEEEYEPWCWWSSHMLDFTLPMLCSILKNDQTWPHSFCFYCDKGSFLNWDKFELWQTALTLCLICLSETPLLHLPSRSFCVSSVCCTPHLLGCLLLFSSFLFSPFPVTKDAISMGQTKSIFWCVY